MKTHKNEKDLIDFKQHIFGVNFKSINKRSKNYLFSKNCSKIEYSKRFKW